MKRVFALSLSGMLSLLLVYQDVDARVVVVTPADRIQKAIDEAEPGDVLLLEDGIYFESIVISKSLTLRAKNGGKATLTNAYSEQLTFTADTDLPGLYSAEVTWPIYWVMVEDIGLYNYRDLDALKTHTVRATYCRRKSDITFATDGFAWENGRFFVRFTDGRDPNTIGLEVNCDRVHATTRLLKNNGTTATTTYVRPTDWPLELHYVNGDQTIDYPRGLGKIVSVQADGVTLEGLRFHLAPHVGVDAENSRDLTIRDCFFDGVQYGINTWEKCENLTVEYCEFSGGRLYERFGKNNMRDAIYYTDLESNIVAQRGPGFVFRHNYIYEAFDGIQPRGTDPSLIDALPDTPSEIAYNAVINCLDNNLELDSWTARSNLRVHHNVVMDGRVILSCAPIQGGPLMIDHNIFYQSPENGSGGVLIKTGQPLSGSVIQSGMRVVHNTFYLVNGRIGAYPGEWADNVFENNIVIVQASRVWDTPGFIPTQYNLIDGPDVNAMHVSHWLHENPGFVDADTGDFRIRSDSPAIGAGVNKDEPYFHGSMGKTDLGAIEYGEAWDFPMPGPRWATASNMPQRPVWPKSATGLMNQK